MFKKTSSKTATHNTSNQTTNNTSTDARVAADGGAIVTRGDVTMVDPGSVTLAGETAESAIDAGLMFGQMGNSLALKSLDATIKTLDRAIDQGRDEGAKITEQAIPWAAAAFIAWKVLK